MAQMAEEPIQRERFDMVHGTLTGLPDVRMTKAATMVDSLPIMNLTTTAVVQTYRSLEEDKFTLFLQLIDATGHQRLVIPDKVARVIYRQRDALMDRSTPESRRRAKAKRDRERARAEKEARSAAWRARHPEGKVGVKR
jgi:hypothetical protein